MNRRDLLRAAGAGALAGLSGCLLGAPDTGSLPPPSTPTEETPTDAPATRTGTAAPTATRTPTTGDGGTTDGTTTPTTTATPTPTATETAPGLQESVTVTVGADGAFYDPREFRLAVGGTVEWVWEGNGHNVVVDVTPDGSDWSGTAGAETKLYDTGHTYTYTFDVPGEYEYHCYRHRVYGMVGSFTVE